MGYPFNYCAFELSNTKIYICDKKSTEKDIPLIKCIINLISISLKSIIENLWNS